MEKGEESVRKIAKSQRIKARWARELYNDYGLGGCRKLLQFQKSSLEP